MALMNQYEGDDKWEAEIRKQDDLLHTCIWKNQSSFQLEGFIAQHKCICFYAAMCRAC